MKLSTTFSTLVYWTDVLDFLNTSFSRLWVFQNRSFLGFSFMSCANFDELYEFSGFSPGLFRMILLNSLSGISSRPSLLRRACGSGPRAVASCLVLLLRRGAFAGDKALGGQGSALVQSLQPQSTCSSGLVQRLPSTVPAFHVGAHLSAGHSAYKLSPCSCAWKAMEATPAAWAPVVHVGDLGAVSGRGFSLDQLWLWWPMGESTESRALSVSAPASCFPTLNKKI